MKEYFVKAVLRVKANSEAEAIIKAKEFSTRPYETDVDVGLNQVVQAQLIRDHKW